MANVKQSGQRVELSEQRAEQDIIGNDPQRVKLSPIATTAPPDVHSPASSQLNRLYPTLDLRPQQSQLQKSSRSRVRDSRAVQEAGAGGKAPADSAQAALAAFARTGHLVERPDIEVQQMDTPDVVQAQAGHDASTSSDTSTPTPSIPPTRRGSYARKGPEPLPQVSASAVSMHARAACFISQRMQTSSSVSQFRQLKALLLYSFLQANTDTLATCRTCATSGHRIDFGNLPKWFENLSSENSLVASIVPGERSVGSPSERSMGSSPEAEGIEKMSPEQQCGYLLAHVRALGRGGACGHGERSFQAYLYTIARGPTFVSEAMGGMHGGSCRFSDLGGSGSRFSDGDRFSDDGGGPAEGGSSPHVGTHGGAEGSTDWVEPLLQCIHTLEVWAVTMLDLTDLRSGAGGGIVIDENSRELLHRRANKAKVGWGPLVVWLCLKVLARMFHITMVLLETLASNDTSLALGVGDITESPVSTPRGASTPMDSQLYAPRARMQPSPLPGLQRSVSASAAGTGRIPGNSTPGATPPGSPQAHSQSAFSTFSPLHIQHNARWQLHVERVTERGLALISLIFRKLEALTQMVLSENNGKRFGLQLDRNHEFWGEVVRDILGEITLPRTPDSCGMHDTLRRTQKVVATLTFRKHLYALFPSGHHLADDYCNLLVAHFRHLASCLCKCLVATNSRLPEATSTARVKAWVTFMMGWQSVAAAPRLLHIVQQAQALKEFCSVLLTQTQVLARMFPDANDCFLFVPGDLETLLFEGDIPSNIFSLWVMLTHKVLGVLKQFAIVWGQVSAQLAGTPGESAHVQGMQERHKIPELRMHVPPHTLGMLKPVFKKLAESNRHRSMICTLLPSSTTEATAATSQAPSSSPRPPVARPVSL